MSWRAAADIGGTFTDIVLLHADGRSFTKKVLSTTQDFSRGIVDGLVALLHAAGVAPGDVTEVLHATTVGSNAVLERAGAKTGLITTEGFRDVLEIRDLRMPRLYDQHWRKPPALVPRRWRLGVRERIRADGSVAIDLDETAVRDAMKFLVEDGIEALAVCLINAYANGDHEARIGAIAHEMAPGLPVCLSHAVLPEIKEYPRTSTTVINAYVLPVVSRYLDRLREGLDAAGIVAPVSIMQSNGGLMASAQASVLPMTIIESGPAAGVIGARAVAAGASLAGAITFDMGGTTAKAALVEAGEILRAPEMQVGGGIMQAGRLLTGAGYTLRTPAIDLAEVGAGGGSIVGTDAAGAPTVGPRSAGSTPGPAAYGSGGTEPTIADCCLLLGYLSPAGLAGGSVPLDAAKARAALAPVAEKLGLSIEAAAHGFFRIATASMMRAVRAVSTERGRDPRDHALIAFGGNGPLFGAALAEAAGMARVVAPPAPGLFSALGLLFAAVEHHLSKSFRAIAQQVDAGPLEAAFAPLEAEARARLAAGGFPPDRQSIARSVEARYLGQSSELSVKLPDLADIAGKFAAEHRLTYGYAAPDTERVEIMGIAVVGTGLSDQPPLPGRLTLDHAGHAHGTRRAWFGTWHEARLLARADLATPTGGPAIVEEYDATCLIPPGWQGSLDEHGNIVLQRLP